MIPNAIHQSQIENAFPPGCKTSKYGVHSIENYQKIVNDRSAPYFLPDMMVAQTSLDGVVWEDVTFLPSNDLGRVSGEVTLLKIAEGSREVKHIKITIRDGSDPSGNWSCRLAGIDLYK